MSALRYRDLHGRHIAECLELRGGAALIAACALALWFGGSLPGSLAQQKYAQEKQVSGHLGAVEIQMRNVNFRIARDIVLEVRMLRGRLQQTKPDIPVTFDDAASFTVEIDSAQVAITAASLTALMNSYVLAYEGAPIKNIVVTIDGNRLIQRGTIHKGADLPFEIEGSLSATEDGNIRVHADKIKAAHIPVKGLLHLLGENLSKLVNQNAGRGMKVVDDNIILNPRTLTPPPHLQGRVTRVTIANGRIVQFFDSGRHPSPLNPPFHSTAYIYHRGGVVRFGKLTMDDADLEIVGDRPGVFDFFQREYQKQLVAGYSKNTPANGLVAHMADYSHFSSHPAPVSQGRNHARTGQMRR
jgi:hypothetical protein